MLIDGEVMKSFLRQIGMAIVITQDPNTRAYLVGLNVIFMNAILRGSAHARPVR